MMAEHERFQTLKHRLNALGFKPRKKLGQNFLIDPALARAIATSLPLDPESLVLEVGAGTGFLSKELARLAGRVIAVEIDRCLVRFLEEEIKTWGAAGDRIRLVATDILDGGGIATACLDALREEGAVERGFVCVSNLPYSSAGPVLAELCCAELVPTRVRCLCQAEMGERILARPGRASYGTLSILLALIYESSLARRVGREVFRPRPKVDSTLLALDPLPAGTSEFLTRSPAQRSAFAAFLQALFAGRRKMLRNSLGRIWARRAGEVLEAHALPSSWLERRIEELAPLEVLALFDAGFDAALLDAEEASQ